MNQQEGYTYGMGFLAGVESVRKWEKFSAEELLTIQKRMKDRIDAPSCGCPMCDLSDESQTEQDFRLALSEDDDDEPRERDEEPTDSGPSLMDRYREASEMDHWDKDPRW